MCNTLQYMQMLMFLITELVFWLFHVFFTKNIGIEVNWSELNWIES